MGRRVTCNRAASVLRRRVREAKAIMRLAGRTQTSIELDEGDEAFWHAVRRLPPRQAQAVALYYLEDYSVREIAEVLDCSEGSVKTHLSRAREVARQLRLEDATMSDFDSRARKAADAVRRQAAENTFPPRRESGARSDHPPVQRFRVR